MTEIYSRIDVDNINRFDGDRGWGYARRVLPKTPQALIRKTRQGQLDYDLIKMPQIFQLAVEVLGLILDNAIVAQTCSDQSSESGEDDSPAQMESESNDDMEDNLDIPNSSGAAAGDGEAEGDAEGKSGDSKSDGSSGKKVAPAPKNSTPISEQELKDALEKQQKFLDGETPKEEIDETTADQITAVEQSGAEEVEVDTGITKTKVMVLNKLTTSILNSGVFPFVEGLPYYSRPDANWIAPQCSNSVKAVKDGFRMGRILSSRLAIRNQNQVTKFNRRPRGKIDKRRLSGLDIGDESVFYNTRMTEYQPVVAHMSIDASGSMVGEKWTRALTVGIAVAVAADTINNLDFVLSIRSGGGNFSGGDGATIAIIYDSREDNPSKIKKLFPYITTAGNTPEGLCFAAILDRLTKERHGDRYFINLSDGEPVFGGYTGSHAHKHTRDQVNHMREAGMNILSYFIGPIGTESTAFKVMYGKDASFIDVRQISKLTGTLNKLFLVR